MQKVKLRSESQLKKMNPELVSALMKLTHRHNLKIPIIYQYSHKLNEPLDPNQECNIGYVKDIWLDLRGNLYCNVAIMYASAASQEFDNVIDNISAKMVPGERRIEVDAFIIYNREAKKLIKEKRRHRAVIQQNEKDAMGQKMAKEGSIPLSNNVDVTDMVEISKQLAEQFEKEIAGQEEITNGRSED